MGRPELDQSMKGQEQAADHMYSFVDSMVLRCAVELRLPDIIHSHDKPITLSQIASSINSPNPNISHLTRIMRFLVQKKIFTIEHPSNGGEPLYGPTNVSRWFVQDSNCNFALFSLYLTHPIGLASWNCLSRCVKEGGYPFKLAHGSDVFEFSIDQPEYDKVFNDAMACLLPIYTRGIVEGECFSSINGTLVDVGGGIGAFLSELVKAHPQIKAINFDQPHVIDTAPKLEGITFVAGDMFESIPNADVIFMKWILHDWDDERCVKILKNCRKSLNQSTGKLLICDIVLNPEGDDPWDHYSVISDLIMMVQNPGGLERTEPEWKKLLEEGGFPRYRIINLPQSVYSLIEAFPS